MAISCGLGGKSKRRFPHRPFGGLLGMTKLYGTEDTQMALKLVRPTLAYEAQVMAFREALLAGGEGFDGCSGLEKEIGRAHV